MILFRVKPVLILLLLAAFSTASSAQKSYAITGFVYDAKTLLYVDKVKISVVNEADSIVAQTNTQPIQQYNKTRIGFLLMFVPSGSYTIRFEHNKYETFEQKLILANRGRSTVDIGNVLLTPKLSQGDIALKEVMVKATLVKMVSNGDTIVYNADAFNLSKGSMLDVLIEELPGVQLKDNGEIFVNGRKVNELLLNGKDFFRNNRNVLLENLPAFMVKDIKVYEKDSPLLQTSKDKPYVMDVGLKKEFRTGWLANAELGGGSGERYLGKLFGLGFSDNSRWSAYANQNNVNDTRRPGRDGEWQPGDTPRGVTTTRKGGIDYYLEDSYRAAWSFNTSNEVIDTRDNSMSNTNSTLFLPLCKNYSLLRTLDGQHNTIWRTDNDFNLRSYYIKGKKIPLRLDLYAGLSYMTFSQLTSNYGFTTASLLDDAGQTDWVEAVFGQHAQDGIFGDILYANKSQAALSGNKLEAKTTADMNYETKSGDKISASVSWEYDKLQESSYSLSDIDFCLNGTSDYRHQYSTKPILNNKLAGEIGYNYCSPSGLIYYSVLSAEHSYNSADRSLFELGRFADGWQNRGLKELPSTRDSLQLVVDAQNSYYSRKTSENITPKFGTSGQIKLNDKDRLGIYITLPISFTHEHLDYTRKIDTTLVRKTAFFTPKVQLALNVARKGNFSTYYQFDRKVPSLLYGIDVRDDANPLFVSLGNNCLKDTKTHSFGVSFSKVIWPKNASIKGTFNTSFDYTQILDAIAMGIAYDTKTGVRTSKPYNVNGNWKLVGRTDFTRSLGKKDVWSLDTHTDYGYLHSVDLTGEDDIDALQRSVVNTLNLGENFLLRRKIGKHSLGLKGRVSYSNIDSKRENFNSMNVCDFNYGLTALLRLPLSLEFSTDLTMYSRRGYDLSSMNSNDLVWNARLSRSFLKGHLTCYVDGFDILGNLSNIQRTVNAQGRTETRYNVLPRYVMAHVIYRFNKPQKKK